MLIPLADVRGIDNEAREKLEAGGISSVEDFLKRAGRVQGRREVSLSTGLCEKALLEWVGEADLKRIDGLDSSFVPLLQKVGITNVRDLALREAEGLRGLMVEVNKAQKWVSELPTLDDVVQWVAQARKLPRIIHY